MLTISATEIAIQIQKALVDTAASPADPTCVPTQYASTVPNSVISRFDATAGSPKRQITWASDPVASAACGATTTGPASWASRRRSAAISPSEMGADVAVNESAAGGFESPAARGRLPLACRSRAHRAGIAARAVETETASAASAFAAGASGSAATMGRPSSPPSWMRG